MLDVGAVAAFVQGHRLAVARMVAQRLQGRRAAALGLGEQIDRPVETDGQDVFVRRNRLVGVGLAHVGAVASDAGGDLRAFVAAQGARQRQQAECRRQVDAVGGHALRQRRALGLDRLVLSLLAELHVVTVGSLAQADLLAALRIFAQAPGAGLAGGRAAVAVLGLHRKGAGEAALRIVGAADEAAGLAEPQAEPAGAAGRTEARVAVRILRIRREEVGAQVLVQRIDDVGDAQLLRLLDGLVEGLPEAQQHLLVAAVSGGDAVEILLQAGGEVVLHVAAEEGGQKGRDDAAAILRQEAFLLQPDVVAVLQNLQDRGVGRGAADAQLFHSLDQARLAEARRRLGEVLLRRDGLAVEVLALGQRRQALAFAVLVLRVVAAFLVERQEAVEDLDRAGGAQARAAAVDVDIRRHLVELGRLHLAGQGAGPDQVVESRLVVAELAADLLGQALQIRRADRLVRLLRVLGLGLVDPGLVRQVAVAVAPGDQLARRRDRLVRHADAVGPHVGDQADGFAAHLDAFIELLGYAHGSGRPEAQLARGLLLQGRGGEGRLRIALAALGFDARDGEAACAFQHRHGLLRLGFAVQVELVELAALQVGEPRVEGRGFEGIQGRRDRPVLLRPEGLDLGLPLADQPQGHRLHAAGGAAARQLAPQHGRQREADQIVERTACQVGLNQRPVEIARMLEGILHGALGDFVEDHALDRLAVERPAAVQLLDDVPGDGLAFAVRVGRQVELLGALQLAGDLLDPLVAAVVDGPVHCEVFVGPHRTVLGRQIAHVAVAGQHPIVATQITFDGLGFGRRFDDDQMHPQVRPRALQRDARTGGARRSGDQRDAVAGMAFEAAGQFQLQEQSPDRRG